MDIQKLLDRSKKSFEKDPGNLKCSYDNSPLIRVQASERLILEPIWEHLDDIEGGLYRRYITANSKYNAVFLRSEVARRLQIAAESLPSHLKLVLKAGHRPLTVQRQKVKISMGHYRSLHKDATLKQALIHARTFVDDPKIKIPSHCCGSAVDVEAFDVNTGASVDYGCPINTTTEAAYIHSDRITAEQKKNRITLLAAMLKAGFAPTFVEWWHFSYGDTVWAYFYDMPESLYGITEPKL